MPTSGLLHFDDAENWIYMDTQKIANGYTDVFAVAIHETGHVLGLSHSRDENSIMAPFYRETVDSSGNYIMPKLISSDITSIQDIYGPRRGGFRTTTERPTARPTTRATTRSFDRSRGEFGDNDWSSWSGFTTRRPSSGSWSPFGGSGSSNWGSWNPTDAWSSWGDWGSWSGSSGGSERGRTRRPSSGSSSGSSWDGNTEVGSGLAGSCPSRLDAISDGPNGARYIYSGGNVYEYSNGKITKTHSLRLLFPKGPIYVDAALSNKQSSTLMLFQGYNVRLPTILYVISNFTL